MRTPKLRIGVPGGGRFDSCLLSGELGGNAEATLNDRLVNTIGWVVLIAWGISFVLDAVRPDYEPPQSVHILMVVVVGAAFAKPALKHFGGKDGE